MSRYSRQELFEPIGPQGQARIRASRVLLVGCGALGTHLAEFCVRAGIGELRIVDRDFVEESNLQRQSLFSEEDARSALPKAVAARIALQRVNSDVKLFAHVEDFNFRNATKLSEGATLVLDGTDNFETRFLVNDLAVRQGIPWVYAGCVGSRATCMPVIPGRSACLRCMLEEQPPTGGETCDTTGVIMPAVMQAVAWASVVALKIMSGNEGALFKKMYSSDLWTGDRQVLDAATPRPDCPCCAKREFPWLEGKRAVSATTLCGRNSVQLAPPERFDWVAGRNSVARGARVTAENDYLLRANSDKLTITLYRNGRALVHGTEDPSIARALYSRLIG
ncbi:MAG: ThiF family adenylyltransferase [Planctomycetes bacterium]|nr:ThiF family adenylyltransferase [Planctomycetota bacterium]